MSFQAEVEVRASDWLLCFSGLRVEPQYLSVKGWWETEPAIDFQTSKSTSSDIIPPTRLLLVLLILPRSSISW